MLLFQAKKFFPYGFGPGNRVEILDAADSDDDEDEGGTYQVLDCKGLGVGVFPYSFRPGNRVEILAAAEDKTIERFRFDFLYHYRYISRFLNNLIG